MKSHKKIFIAFLLNLFFSIFEFIGGAITGSVAIASDAIHDLGDSLSIGLSFIFEKISKKKPDNQYTYGYIRYSVLGGVITTTVLLFGSMVVVFNALHKIVNPTPIHYNGMIVLAFIGASVNFLAAYFTTGGHSLNQKSVNLHMLEDVLGWIVVLIGAVVMKITDISLIDPILSIAAAVFIFINALSNLKSILNIFLEKTPDGINIDDIVSHLVKIEGVCGVHHIHVRSIDGFNNYATLHVVTNGDAKEIKAKVKAELLEHGIAHATVEIEAPDEKCHDIYCHVPSSSSEHSHHHNHHHSHNHAH